MNTTTLNPHVPSHPPAATPRAAALQRWLCRTPAPSTVFVLVITLALCGLGAWAAMAPIDVIVRAEGRIIPAGKPQIVQHLEGGIVSAILVKEGEPVQAGQPLMELSDVRARADVGQGQSRLMALRAREARLEAEASGRGVINYPAEVDDAEVKRAETNALLARRGRLAEEAGVLRSQSRQKQAEIAEAESRATSQGGEFEVARRQHAVLEGLRAKGAASQLEVLESQARMQRLKSMVDEAQGSLPRLRAAVGEIQARLQESEAKFRAEASAELTQVRGEIARIDQEVGAGVDRLERSIVTAPKAGVVNRLSVTTVGGVVKPGESLMEITPVASGVAMEGKVRPNDRASLQNGQKARLRIGAYDYATHGVVEASVTEVSADTLVDDRGERFYRLRLETPDHTSLQPLPGMTAQADVVVGQRTVLSYLLSPLTRFRDTAFRDPR